MSLGQTADWARARPRLVGWYGHGDAAPGSLSWFYLIIKYRVSIFNIYCVDSCWMNVIKSLFIIINRCT